MKTPKIWAPVPSSKEQHRAVQAVADYAEGRTEVAPGPHQMKVAWDWILYGACQLREDPFVNPGQEDVRTYVIGRQSVARAILKLATVKVDPQANEVTNV